MNEAQQLQATALLYSGRFRPTISREHVEELRTYFRNAGLGVFDRSTLGTQLYRAELYARPARPCVRCGGSPASGRAGSGFIPLAWLHATSRAKPGRQRLSDETRIEFEMVRFAEQHPGEHFDSTETCPSCHGAGWVPGQWPVSGAPTARPTGSSIGRTGGVNVSDVAMHALAVVSSRLAIAVRIYPEAEQALESYYGPDGGGIVNVWPLTTAGKTLLRRNSLKLDPLRFLANERAAQEEKPTANRRALFASCDEQAKGLMDTAGRAWNAAVGLARGEE